MSELEEQLLAQIRGAELPEPVREYRFSQRRYRFDFAWPEQMLAVEVEGGTWNHGRHTRGTGFESDCRKYNSATLHGWLLLRFTGAMIENDEAIAMIADVLSGE